MSITEVPLVASYRQVVARAEGQSQDDVLDEVRQLRSLSSEDAIAHGSAVETVFRERLVELVAALDIEEDDYAPVWVLLDNLNILCDNELCDSPLTFNLIEDLLDSQTISGCRKVFKYLESRRERMTRLNFDKKNQSTLRCCNELLRRLSRAEDTVFCGRVFIYLFQCFPLGDKSSVNLRGEFHVENITTYDENPGSEDSNAMDVDANDNVAVSDEAAKSAINKLYPMFWSLQTIFSSPAKLFEPQSMTLLKDGIGQTLNAFTTMGKDIPSTNNMNEEKRGTKRKIGNINGDHSELDSSTFNPKYLTNRHLFDLEIHDIEFRRHVLVQSLVLLDFLLSLSAQNKAKLATMSQGRGIMSALYDKHTLSEDDKTWCQDTRRNIERYLETDGNGTEGRMFVRMVNMVLSRDKNWALWKVEGCPPISLSPVEDKITTKSSAELLKLSELAKKPLTKPKGSDQLNFLSQNEAVDMAEEKTAEPPSLEQYYNDIQTLDLDLDFATDEEKKDIQEQKAGKLWRALRSANGKRFALCEDIKNGQNIGALVGKKEDANIKTNGDHEEVTQEGKEETVTVDQPDSGPEHLEQSEIPDTSMNDNGVSQEAEQEATESVETEEPQAVT